MWYFGLFAGWFALFWWPAVVFILLFDTIYFTRSSYLMLSDQDEEEVGIVLGISFIIGLVTLHLFGIFDVVSFVYNDWDTLLKFVGAYVVVGVVYMAMRGIARIRRFRKKVRDTLLDAKSRFKGSDEEWEKAKAAQVEELRPKASRHKGWMVSMIVLWLPDMVFRALFKWWIDGLRQAITFCQNFIQKQVIDRLWTSVGDDI